MISVDNLDRFENVKFDKIPIKLLLRSLKQINSEISIIRNRIGK